MDYIECLFVDGTVSGSMPGPMPGCRAWTRTPRWSTSPIAAIVESPDFWCSAFPRRRGSRRAAAPTVSFHDS